MTNKELQYKLKEFSDDTDILLCDYKCGYREINDIFEDEEGDLVIG